MLMPCVSKKEEILDSEDIDYVITTRELIYLINEANVDLENVIPSEFDKLAGYASSSGIIFGTSGGVLEAVLRSAYYFINNKKMPDEMLNLNLDNDLLFKENTYDMGKLKINVASNAPANNVKFNSNSHGLYQLLPNGNEYNSSTMSNYVYFEFTSVSVILLDVLRLDVSLSFLSIFVPEIVKTPEINNQITTPIIAIMRNTSIPLRILPEPEDLSSI